MATMAPIPGASQPSRKYDGAEHAIREFSAGVALMVEDDKKVDIGSLIENLVKALQGQAQKPAVHPIMYVNLAFILGLAFACGSLWTRVAAMESKSSNLDAVSVVSYKVDVLQTEMKRLEDRDERIEDHLNSIATERRGK